MKENNEHRRYYNPNGKEVPSCTTIVSLLNKPELVPWANYMGFKHINTTKLLEDKARFGTYCHELFERYFQNSLMTLRNSEKIISDEDYKDALIKFKVVDLYFEKYGYRVLNNELGLEGKKYGGTLDMIVYDSINDKLIIFDLKTSKRIYDSHWIQLMGYVQLVEEIYGLPVESVGVILLSKPYTSKLLITIRKTKECNKELNIFNSLLSLYYAINEVTNNE